MKFLFLLGVSLLTVLSVCLDLVTGERNFRSTMYHVTHKHGLRPGRSETCAARCTTRARCVGIMVSDGTCGLILPGEEYNPAPDNKWIFLE
jgi:hypothetical protein